MSRFEDAYLEPKGLYYATHDDSFVTGDSPVVLDVKTNLGGKNGIDGYIANDGAGEFTFAISHDGTNYEDEIKVLPEEMFSLNAINMNKIRITWISNTKYRLFVRA